MALKFGSGNTTRKLKLVKNDPIFGPRLGEYTHFVLCQLFNKEVDTYVWGYGHWGQTQSLTTYITSGSGGNNTGNMVTVSSIDSGTASANGFSGHPETDLVLYAIRGQGGYPDLGSPKSIQYTSTIVIGGQASGVPDLRQSPEVYGNAWAWPDSRITPVSDIPFHLGGDDDYYGDRKLCGYMHMAGTIDRYLTDDELRGIVTGRIAVLDSFQSSARELWDFSLNSDAALSGLIGGKQLEKIGSGWAWEDTAYRRPASRVLKGSISGELFKTYPFTRGWKIGEVTGGGGSDVINCTPATLTLTPAKAGVFGSSMISAVPATLTLTPAKAGIFGSSIISTAPATLTLVAEKAGLTGTGAINTTAASLTLTPAVANIVSSAAGVINCAPATLSLTAAKAGVFGWQVLNTTPADLTLTPEKVGVVGAGVINTSPVALTITPAKASITGVGVVNTSPAGLTITPALASIVTLSAGVVNCTPATLTLTAAKAGIVGSEVLNTIPANLTLTAAKVGIVSVGVINTTAISLTITPTKASIITTATGVINTIPATMVLTPHRAGFAGDDVIGAIPAVITLASVRCAVVSYSVVSAKPVTLMLRGVRASVDDRPDPVSSARLQVTDRRVSLKVA